MERGEQSATPTAARSGREDDEGRLHALGVVLLVVVGSFVAAIGWAAVLAVPVAVAVQGEPSDLQLSMLEPPAVALGFGTGALAYFANSSDDVSSLDVSLPRPRSALYVVGGVGLLLGLNYLAEYLYHVFAIPQPQHGTVETISAAGPEVALYFVVASLLFIGPAEELLFRNVVQKRLTASYGWVGAVLVSSAVFAVAHSSAYWNADPLQLAGSLATVFVLSLVLGVIYERTRNLPVVALIHGGYDAVLFAIVGFGGAG